jgi:hypothetical protein
MTCRRRWTKYSRTLLRVEEEKREYAQRLFRCLMVSIRPLCVEELAEILALQFDEVASPIFNAGLVSGKPRRNGDVRVFQSHRHRR